MLVISPVATGEITSTDMIAYTDGANRTLTRTYTSGADSISETVFLTVTEDSGKTVIRQATSELDIHNLDGLTINAISGNQSGATQGSCPGLRQIDCPKLHLW